jgi:hypothetical protein
MKRRQFEIGREKPDTRNPIDPKPETRNLELETVNANPPNSKPAS